jgi:hypothetical protein
MTIRTSLLDSSDAFTADPRQNHLVNMAALKKAEVLRATYAHRRCTDHPDHDAVLIVTALATGHIVLDRSGMCCDNFAQELR